ncbi:MAG: di-heme oxidoredictase family protein, partial [Steroidobacteraceae bacterium]
MTVIKPRLAPGLFGAGLLDAVPDNAIGDGVPGARPDGRASGNAVWYSHQGRRMVGRFGWQGQSVSTRDQTTKALAHEMGVTSSDRDTDDCTSTEADCLKLRISASPEISDDLLDAVVAYLRTLAVPESPLRADENSPGSRLFMDIGCGECHQPRLPVELQVADGSRVPGVIAPYTDLRLHDLGLAMGDETASGAKVTTKWRTAPLWGLGYRIKMERYATFLHDGRARTVEEAILWHSGEAAPQRSRFVKLGPRSREALIRWLGAL